MVCANFLGEWQVTKASHIYATLVPPSPLPQTPTRTSPKSLFSICLNDIRGWPSDSASYEALQHLLVFMSLGPRTVRPHCEPHPILQSSGQDRGLVPTAPGLRTQDGKAPPSPPSPGVVL